MKVRNLADYPQPLGDGRIVGAAGTSSDTRDYDLDELTREDKKLVKRGALEIVEEKPAEKPEPEKAPVSDSQPLGSQQKTGGNK